MKKVCSKCNLEQDIENFHKWKKSKDKYRNKCKKCTIIEHKVYYENNKEKIMNRNKIYNKKNPWLTSYRGTRDRCLNPRNDMYEYYGGKGIKFVMVLEDFKSLWFRDQAYLMKKPSIDRIDPDGHYTFENCRYIEFSKNIANRNKDCKLRRLLHA